MDYNYDAIGAGFSVGYAIVGLIVSIVLIVALWKIFEKAGKPGWGTLIPLYNTYCMYDIAFSSGWLFLLTFVPVVGSIMAIILVFKLAKAFGKGVGFGFGLLFLMPIFLLILAFGDAEYVG